MTWIAEPDGERVFWLHGVARQTPLCSVLSGQNLRKTLLTLVITSFSLVSKSVSIS